MLCDVVAESKDGQIPQNRGELFRQEFARRYERFKPLRGRVSEDSRRFAPELLQHLAFVMTQGEPHTDPLKPTPSWLTIPKAQAENILAVYLSGGNNPDFETTAKSKEFLEDLLEHHLLQIASDPDQIEFHHQLFQGYYAAEYLLRLLPKLSDTELKQNYLNYLKWTEAIALMLSLTNEEAWAITKVSLALEVDLMLGTRFIGEMKVGFQERAFSLIDDLNINEALRIDLIGNTNSTFAINLILQALEQPSSIIRKKAIEALIKLDIKAALSQLLKLSSHPDLNIRIEIIKILSQPDMLRVRNKVNVLMERQKTESQNSPITEDALRVDIHLSQKSGMINLVSLSENLSFLTPDSYKTFCDLFEIDGGKITVPELSKLIHHPDFGIRFLAIESVGESRVEILVSELLEAIEDENDAIRESATYSLGKIGGELAIPGLLQALEDNSLAVCWSAAQWLGKISDEVAIPGLIQAFEKKNNFIRWKCVEALESIGDELVIPELIRLLEHPDLDTRSIAACLLGKLGSKAAIPELNKALDSQNSLIRETANEALNTMISEGDFFSTLRSDSYTDSEDIGLKESRLQNQASNGLTLSDLLLNDLESSDSLTRWKAVEILGEFPDDIAVPQLLKLLKYLDPDVRWRAAVELGKTGSKLAVKGLLESLEDRHPFVRWRAVGALGRIGDETAIPGFAKMLNDGDSFVRWSAIDELERNGSEAAILELFGAFHYSDSHLTERVVNAFSRIGRSNLLPHLWQFELAHPGNILPAIQSIQNACNFYSYEIAQSALEDGRGVLGVKGRDTGQIIHNTYNIGTAENLNTGNVTIHGNQVGEQYQQPNLEGERHNG